MSITYYIPQELQVQAANHRQNMALAQESS